MKKKLYLCKKIKIAYMRIYLLFIYFIVISLSVSGKEFYCFEGDTSESIFAKSKDRELAKITTSTYLEDTASRNKWSVKAGGYISTDLFWDTRTVIDSRDGMLCLYPENVQKDISGKDINARPSFNFLALNTRISLRIQSPDALGAKISGMVEGWFAGMSNNDMNGFSMRHAFIKMDWEKSSLLMGQTWHPLFTENCFANTVAGSAGAPFQPFSRSAQIRFTQNFLKHSKAMFYISSQRDFLSSGSIGASSSYLRNSAMPEMGVQYIFTNYHYRGGFLFGLGYDYKYLIPRIITDSNLYTRKGINSQAVTVFIHYYKKNGRVSYSNSGIKAKAMYSRGCNEFLTLGGYAFKFYNNDFLNLNNDYQYTTLNSVSSWIDIYMQKNHWEFGLFGGFAKNLGSQHRIQNFDNPQAYFARGRDIDYLYRVSFRTVYTVREIGKNLIQFGIEPEYTAATYSNRLNEYGLPQKKSDLFPDAKINHVGNLRILLNATLYF